MAIVQIPVGETSAVAGDNYAVPVVEVASGKGIYEVTARSPRVGFLRSRAIRAGGSSARGRFCRVSRRMCRDVFRTVPR